MTLLGTFMRSKHLKNLEHTYWYGMERNSLYIGQSFEDVSLFESGKRQLSIIEVCLVAIIWKSFRFYNQESIMASWWFMVNLLHLHTVREFGNRWLSNSELHSHLAFECYLINKLSLNVKQYVYLFDSYVFLQLLLWFRKSILEYR